MEITTPDGVSIWWERTGSGPVVALVPGRGDSSDLYPAEFSERLVEAGFGVLRFDPRDTGLSGDGGADYTLTTMAEDLLAVLDAAGLDRVDLMGISMGGMTLVDLASRHTEQVRSQIFLSAMSPDPEAGFGEDFFAAIGADPVEANLRAMGSPDRSDRDWVIGRLARAEERAPARPEATQRHQDAAFRGDWPGHERLRDITVAALVIHGSADRVLPIAHATSLGEGIADSDVRVLEGMGHLPTQSEWTVIADLVVAFLQR